jgi:glycerate kinase
MRIVVSPQEFKGSLTASEAAAALADGLRDAAPDSTVDPAPVSDGGPGLVTCMLAAVGGEPRIAPVHGPLLAAIDAEWALLDGGIAVIEMAAASGLVLVPSRERDPLITTSYGTGELILAALAAGARSLIVGVGGSATVDGGAGALSAMGARLLDAAGDELPAGGAALARLDRIDTSQLDRRLRDTDIRVACDVTNPLCGPDGAAAVFAPQKGATPEAARMLERALKRLADVAARDAGVDLLAIEGGGAAGGLAAGLALIGARVEPGFPIVADALRLDARIAASDLVVTGEGRLDGQTAFGKAAAGVAGIANRHGVPCIIVAGTIAPDADTSAWAVAEPSAPYGMGASEAMSLGAELLRRAATRAIARWNARD